MNGAVRLECRSAGGSAAILVAWLAALCWGWSARADSVQLVGEREALTNARIVTITSGAVSFADAAGRLHVEPIGRIARLGWDDLPESERAHEAIASRDHAAARTLLMQGLASLDEASPRAQRIWLRAQLALAHAALQEHVQAVGHAAVVFTLDDHEAWADLVPEGRMSAPPFAAAAEALGNLQSADETVRSPQLRARLDLWLVTVRAMHERLARHHDGPPFEPGRTLSGVPIDQLRKPVAQPEGSRPKTPRQSAPGVDSSTGETVPPNRAGETVDSIDRLIQAGRFAEAVDACASAARRPDERSLSRLLHQYGRALEGAGRPRDAAVMYMRCAILYADSTEAPAALVATAAIYKATYDDPATARRLLERAIADLQHRDDAEMLTKAQAAIRALDQPTSNP
jgi:tetratricopeptide (TPR) repeat protein